MKYNLVAYNMPVYAKQHLVQDHLIVKNEQYFTILRHTLRNTGFYSI